MFEKYPKIRPALPDDIRAIYSAQYKSNRDGDTPAASLAQKMEAWMHRQVARDVRQSNTTLCKTLELGAGTLNQLDFEPSVADYDIVEPFTDLYRSSKRLRRIKNIYSDIAEIPVTTRYDRITSIATLEHICHLPKLIAHSGILLNENGVFRASIPSEGTLFWTLGWKLTTGLEFRLKHGLDYGVLMRHEHVNTAREIEDVLHYFFDNMTCKVFGLSKSLSLYRYYECRNPRLQRCSDFLTSLD